MLTKEQVLNRLHEVGVIGIFRVDSKSECFDAMEALRVGGLDAFEITTTTPNTAELVSEARRKYGDEIIIGMGTVLDGITAERGIEAGAQFIVSPSLHEDVVVKCRKLGVVCCPGTFSATEVAQAWKWGADLVKLFPISPVGPEYMKALMAPFPYIHFVPTGGIDAKNAGEYIRAGAFCLGVGGSLVSKKAIAEGRFDLLTKAANDILTAVRDARR
jgi:2-dehydro-3-deoxyphosphogluconate aldolase / (4S)-4-hydroxy-2-oxoglutarate aldolase